MSLEELSKYPAKTEVKFLLLTFYNFLPSQFAHLDAEVNIMSSMPLNDVLLSLLQPFLVVNNIQSAL